MHRMTNFESSTLHPVLVMDNAYYKQYLIYNSRYISYDINTDINSLQTNR